MSVNNMEAATLQMIDDPQYAMLRAAILFHDTYERLAPAYGYETRPDTKRFDPTSANGMLMIDVCAVVIAAQVEPYLSLLSQVFDGIDDFWAQQHPEIIANIEKLLGVKYDRIGMAESDATNVSPDLTKSNN